MVMRHTLHLQHDLSLPEEYKNERPKRTDRTISIGESRDIVLTCLEYGIAPEDFDEALKVLIDNDGKNLVIGGWVARDEDDTLWFHHIRPHKIYTKEAYYNCWVWYSASNSRQIESPKVCSLFKFLKWDDEPVEIELVIIKFDSALAKSTPGITNEHV